MERLKKLLRDQKGEIAVEYALVAGLMALAIVGAIGVFSGSLETLFTTLATKVTGYISG